MVVNAESWGHGGGDEDDATHVSIVSPVSASSSGSMASKVSFVVAEEKTAVYSTSSCKPRRLSVQAPLFIDVMYRLFIRLLWK